MSNDHSPTPDDEIPQPGQPMDFNAINWQVLIGMRTTTNEQGQANGMEVAMVATPEVYVPTPQGDRPDKRIAVVHFAQWINDNKEHITALWEPQYAQYMNLRRLTERAPTLKDIGLVDPQGQRFDTGRTTQ